MHEEPNESPPKTYKITFLGSPSVGKTSIIIQYIYQNLTTPQSTVGIDFFIKQATFPIFTLSENKTDQKLNNKEDTLTPDELELSNQKTITVKLKICDTAGQERFNSMISGYTRDSFVTCVVFDITNRKTLESIEKWVEMAEESNNGNKTKILIIGNKTDLVTNYKPREYKSVSESPEDIKIDKEIGELGIEDHNEELNEIRTEIQRKCKNNKWFYCETSALDFKTVNELDSLLNKIIEEDLKANNYFLNRSNSEIEIFKMNKVKSKKWFCF